MFFNNDIPLTNKAATTDWTPKLEGITLAWNELTVYAAVSNDKFFGKSSRTCKRIINNVTGVVKAGTLVALMGPSGAGKSTLMGALAYRNANGMIVDGDIRVNGSPIGDYVHKISGFMDQQDLFVDTLSVREHLQFMAQLKLPRSKKRREIDRTVDEFLTQLGLLNCANNRIGGGAVGKVLSGGERKRLAFATEMLTNPPLLFCDEPTTGLDSYSAKTLVNFMKIMASEGRTIVCTIHQPSSELFDMFDQILLLSEGRIAYMGNAKEAITFFRKHGYVCPVSYNPADFFIRCLATSPGGELESRMKMKHVCDEFIVSESNRQMESLVYYELNERKSSSLEQLRHQLQNIKEALWTTKLFILTYRGFLQVFRDPSIQTVRIIQKVVLALMAGLCYLGTVNPNQSGVQSVQGAVFICVTENTFSAMYSVLSHFPMERPLFMREYRNGLYTPQQYYLSKLLSLSPGMILEPILFTLVLYWLAGLRGTAYAFLMTVFITVMTMNVAAACGCFFSNAFSSVSIAMACLIPFDYVLMITSGLFIKLDSMPDIIGWFKYMSWFMYSNEAMSILQWEDVHNITCEFEDPSVPCLRNGNEVLDKYDFAVSHLPKDILAMTSLYFIFHTLAFCCLYWRAKRNR